MCAEPVRELIGLFIGEKKKKLRLREGRLQTPGDRARNNPSARAIMVPFLDRMTI